MLFRDLLASLGMGSESPEARVLGREIAGLASGEQLRDWRARVEAFLHPPDAEGRAWGWPRSKPQTAPRPTTTQPACAAAAAPSST